jgi:hypothetical protein
MAASATTGARDAGARIVVARVSCADAVVAIRRNRLVVIFIKRLDESKSRSGWQKELVNRVQSD